MIRAMLVLGCLLVLALTLYGMRIGWRHLAQRQAGLPALPAVSAEPGPSVLEPVGGLYVGTVLDGSWQERVVAHGLGSRAAATLTPRSDGVLVERQGAAPIYLPSAVIRGAGLGAGLAGKVTGAGGLLVIRWQLGDTLLQTGFAADDKSRYPEIVRAIEGLVAAR